MAALSPSDELRGYHFEQAHRFGTELGSPDPEVAARAAAALAAAGSRAHERSDMPAALNFLTRALALSSPDDPSRPGLIHRLALARLETGDGALADEGFELAIREAERSGNRRVEWIARLDAVAHESRGTDLKDVATRALEVVEALDDHVGLAHAWRRLSVSALRRCSFAEAEHAAELALDYARRAGETHQLGRTVDNLCTAVLYGPAPADEAARRCRELLAETEGDLLVEASVLSSLADLEAMLGRFDEARELAARAHADFEQLGLRRLDAGLSEIEGDIELLAGDPVAAERAFRRGQALLTGGETRMLVTLLAEATLLQGRLEEAEQLAFEAEEFAADDAVAVQVRLLGVRARLLSRRGEPDAALTARRGHGSEAT